MRTLPLVTRNYSQIIALNPGVAAEVPDAGALGPGFSGPQVPGDRGFCFEQCERSEREGELRKNSARIKLQEQPFEVLVELLANAGRVVKREQLQQKLWPADTFVDFDVGLNTAIRLSGRFARYWATPPTVRTFIETSAKRGYSFSHQ